MAVSNMISYSSKLKIKDPF